jgi:molybdate transport system substrate-binding protein
MSETLRMIGVGALKDAFARILPDFTRDTGLTVTATWDTVGAQRDRALSGEPADLVVLSTAAMDAVAARGLVDSVGRLVLGTVEVALAVPAAAPVPDVSTVEGLRRALRAARTISHADPARGATAGMHFAKVLQALDLGPGVAAKVRVLPFGVEVVAAVGRGEFDLGVSQSSEIAIAPGVNLVMPLPPEFRLETAYEIAPGKDAASGAALLLERLRTPDSRAVLDACGFRR